MLATRFVLSVLTLLLVAVIVFGLTELLPGDVATARLGREATPELLAKLRGELGLDRPAPARFVEWVGGALRGDFGTSLAQNQPVADLVGARLRNTLLLAGIATLVGVPCSFGLGVLAAVRRNRPVDVAISVVALVLMSLPEFVIGSLLILFLAIRWPRFPAVTTLPPDAPLGDLLPNAWLPALTLTFVMAAYLIRMVRASLIEALASDHVRGSTLAGVPRWRVVLRHALPSALLPALSATAQTVAWLVGGVVVVETVFNYPGLGTLLVGAVADRDIPLVQALALLGALAYVLANLVADALSLVLNPRLRTLRA